MKRLCKELGRIREDFQQECRQDVPGIIRARTYATDVLQAMEKHLKKPSPQGREWFLAAVGGFGRGDLSFVSDLDLLFLYRKNLSAELQEMIESLIQDLWDMGFEVGHTVSTVPELDKLMETDFSVKTTYLETRFVCGHRGFYDSWRSQVFRRNRARKKKRDFLESVKSSRQSRVKRYAESIYILEPHIKEGLGGLRDVHALRWLGGLFLGRPEYESLLHQGWITYLEHHWLEQAHDFLWRVRLQLHSLQGRRKDRLLLQDQTDLASRLGFLDGEQGISAVEVFMRRYYRQTARIRRVTDFLLERLSEDVAQNLKKRRPKVLPGPFVLEGEHIHFHDPELVHSDPKILMRIFWQASQSGAHFHHGSGQIIRSNLDVFDRSLREDRELADLFFDIIQNPREAYRVLKVMMETGFLETYLPEFSEIRYRVQYDLYHIYTVDEHLLKTLQELHTITRSEQETAPAPGSPDPRELFRAIENKRVLFLGGLVHDLGKGHGHGHAERGARLVVPLARRLHVSEPEITLLSSLVENHVLLAETALKRDLFDEKPIERCALKIGSLESLYMLYLLTVSDSRATGPQVWNTWRRSLINELFFKVENLLNNRQWQENDLTNRIAACREYLQKHLADRSELEEVLAWLEGLSFRYLLARQPEEFYRHYQLEKKLREQTLVLDVRSLPGQMWEATFICNDRPLLFDLLTGVFWAYGVNILSADIYTRGYGVAVDILIVDQIPDPLHPEKLWDKIRKDLALILTGEKQLETLLAKSRPDRIGLSNPLMVKEDKVVIDEQASDFYTVIEVYTWERTGVLHTISKVLHRFDLSIQLAKISTPGAQVVDVFYVTAVHGGKILDQKTHSRLETELLSALQPG
ncbi:MAG: [protein-PII] uridylyltransferase [Desulfohalobiaceae bacterium]|nr:[protein-PII] uridylyltransferase [Desulfohalobiaceae bacterium]